MRFPRLAIRSKLPYEPLVDKEKSISKNEAVRVASARKSLLEWHKLHGRHDLPWRESHDPYHVLVSEFMLQQTTVATVKPRFLEWMERFPTILVLAAVEEQEVLSAWEGLGYYSRARRLHQAAKVIVAEYQGQIPDDQSALLTLPGIGAYTAGAILAFAHDKPAIVLDTNIIRVLARWSNLHTPIDTAEGKAALEAIAKEFFLISKKLGSRAIASALMDLGAMLCTAGAPQCNDCPLQKTCLASTPESLPKKSPRAVTTKLIEHRLWLWKNNQLFLQQSSGPRWRGLWILPELGETKPVGRTVAEITYPITRYRVTMKVFASRSISTTGLRGFHAEDLDVIAIPSPHRRVITKLLGQL